MSNRRSKPRQASVTALRQQLEETQKALSIAASGVSELSRQLEEKRQLGPIQFSSFYEELIFALRQQLHDAVNPHSRGCDYDGLLNTDCTCGALSLIHPAGWDLGA